MKKYSILFMFLVIFSFNFALTDVRNVKDFASIETDTSGRNAENTVFGDRIVAVKHDIIGTQFQYNVTTYDAITTVTTFASVSVVSSAALLATSTISTAATITATLQSKQALRYRPGKEGYFYFTAAFTTSPGTINVGTTSSIQYIGLWDDTDGFYVGFNNLDFVVGKKRNGTDTQVKRERFNKDVLDGTGDSKFNVDFSKLNLFRISYGWLGTAPIVFEICTTQGKWIPFHVIEYPNTEILPSIYNPVLPIRARVGKTATGNAINVQLRSSSWSAGIMNGSTAQAGNRYFTATTSKSITANVRTNLFTIRNNSTFQGVTNKIMIKPVKWSVTAEGTKPTKFAIWRNATLAGSPTYSAIRTDASVCSIDYAGTTVSGSNLDDGIYLQKSDSKLEDLTNDEINVFPGETITFTALSAANADVDIIVRWEEQF